MPGDEFEIVPKKEIEGLKKDVNDIKKDPLGSAPAGKNLSGSIENLTKSMDNMFELFKVANKEIKDEASSLEFMKQIAPLFDNMNKKIDNILEQHDKIADGIVAIAELVKQMKEENQMKAKRETMAIKPKPVAPTPTAPSLPEPTPPRMAPSPGVVEPGSIQGNPPFMSPQ